MGTRKHCVPAKQLHDVITHRQHRHINHHPLLCSVLPSKKRGSMVQIRQWTCIKQTKHLTSNSYESTRTKRPCHGSGGQPPSSHQGDTGLEPTPTREEFIKGKSALGRVLIWVFRFSFQYNSINVSHSFTDHQRYTILATTGLKVKKEETCTTEVSSGTVSSAITRQPRSSRATENRVLQIKQTARVNQKNPSRLSLESR
jgi:hypothetical protein